MDPIRFDRLARTLSLAASRRGMLTALASLALAGPPAWAEARKKDRKGNPGKRKGKGKRRPANLLVCHNGETLRLPPEAVRAILLAGGQRGACPGGSGSTAPDCSRPGPNRNLSGCNFNYRDFSEVNLSAATMVGTTFRGADLCGATLRSSQLRNADLRGFPASGPNASADHPVPGRSLLLRL